MRHLRRLLSPCRFAGAAASRGRTGSALPDAGGLDGQRELAPSAAGRTALAEYATPAQKERWFAPLLAGKAICAVGMTEPEAGSALTDLRRHGFAGEVLPINPRAETILGARAYPSLDAAQGPIDHACILLGADRVEAAVAACTRRRVPVAMILSDGFAEAGAEGAARQQRVLAAARAAGCGCSGRTASA